KTDGVLEFVLRLKRPLQGDDVRETKTTRFVVDLPGAVTTVAHPPPSAATTTTTAAAPPPTRATSGGTLRGGAAPQRKPGAAAVTKPAANKPAAAASHEADDDDGLPNPSELVSFEVLTFYIADLQNRQAARKTHEVAELLEELQLKIALLQQQVQLGVLSQ